jgi:hypothetical protein
MFEWGFWLCIFVVFAFHFATRYSLEIRATLENTLKKPNPIQNVKRFSAGGPNRIKKFGIQHRPSSVTN